MSSHKADSKRKGAEKPKL